MKMTYMSIAAIATVLSTAAAFGGTTINLSLVTSDTVALSGDTLTDTLSGNFKISIADSATVTLNGVTINGVNDSVYSWAGITCEGSCTIILEGENKVTGFYEGFPGIFVPEDDSLYIEGEGSLEARSNGYAAGIGGGHNINGGNIVIEDGMITALGGFGGAGIGGGYEGAISSIEIVGGTVMATGGDSAAGIGGGLGGSVGLISFGKNVPKVTAKAGENAPYSIGLGANAPEDTNEVSLVNLAGVEFEKGVADSVYLFQTYLVYFDANGGFRLAGSQIGPQYFFYDAPKVELLPNPYFRNGYTFNGWNTKENGKGDAYADRDSVQNLTDSAGGRVCLHAQWLANKYVIRFDANGGTGTMDSMSVAYDKEAELLKNKFVRKDFVFNGWNTMRNGKGDQFQNNAKVKNLTDKADATVKLYAQWVKKLSHSDIIVLYDSLQTYTGAPLNPEVVVIDGKTVLTKGKDYSVNYSRNKNAGVMTATIVGKNDYAGEVTVAFKIAKADSKLVLAPRAFDDLVYTGKDQTLVRAGTAKNGTVLYKLGLDGNYSEDIPTARYAGKYVVYYKVVGDKNYNDVSENFLVVKIEKRASKLAIMPSAVKDLVYTGEEQFLVNAGAAENGTVLYKLGKDGEYSEKRPKATEPGTYTVYFMVQGDRNYSDVSEMRLTVEIAEKPTSIGQARVFAEQYEMERNFDLKGRKLQGQSMARGAYVGRMKLVK